MASEIGDRPLTNDVVLECRGVGKRFQGTTVLERIDWQLRRGEIHGIVGCNGAGKSTLMKILAGALPDHEGDVLLDGSLVRLSSPRVALERGVSMVYQELSGIGSLSVAENLFLGRAPLTRVGTIDWREMRRRAVAELKRLDLELDVDLRLDRYPLAVRQLVEIARGLSSGARILILDEPTSALSPPETQRLFDALRKLRDERVSIILITHFLDDALSLADRLTVLKDGVIVGEGDTLQWSKSRVIEAMLGHALDAEEGVGTTLPPRATSPPRLIARSLSRRGSFEEIDLEIAAGECVGLFGFMGAGHQELTLALAGAARIDRGEVAVEGRPLRLGDVSSAISAGMVLVAGDRAKTVVRQAPLYQNVTLSHLRTRIGGWLTKAKEWRVAVPTLEQVGCRPMMPSLPAGRLSGGNQQKVVLGKWLLGPIRVLLLDEPTRGMDVGAKQEVMEQVRTLREQKAAVLLASSEPELILAHADRILVFRRGRIARTFEAQRVTKRDLLDACA